MLLRRPKLLSNWIIFLLVGRVLIYLWFQLPLPDTLENHRAIAKLHMCDLCAGFWIYGFLSFFMALSLLEALGFTYVPIVSEIVTGSVVSFLTHIFTIGWKERFHNILVI